MSLTHRSLANVVGARRPSVTTALSELQRRGRLARVDTGWLLLGRPPAGSRWWDDDARAASIEAAD
jgi:hypothetical protein